MSNTDLVGSWLNTQKQKEMDPGSTDFKQSLRNNLNKDATTATISDNNQITLSY